jgi:hypothetical protein
VIIAKRIEGLTKIQAARDTDTAMAHVAELLLAFPSAQMSLESARARGKAYVTGLEGVPTYAIVEACRRWLRGQCGEQNYSFAPSAPVLRGVAEDIAKVGQFQIDQLQRVLDAQVIPDPAQLSDDHREGMLKRLTDMFRGLSLSPDRRALKPPPTPTYTAEEFGTIKQPEPAE